MRGLYNDSESRGYAPIQSGRRSSWIANARRIFKGHERSMEYPVEKQAAPIFYVPTYAAESFMRTATSRDMKKFLPETEA